MFSFLYYIQAPFCKILPLKEEEKVYTHVTTDVSNTEGNPSDPFNTFFHWYVNPTIHMLAHFDVYLHSGTYSRERRSTYSYLINPMQMRSLWQGKNH